MTADLYAYVSSDGRTVTDRHGTELGKVIETRQIPLARWSYIHGRHITHYRVSIDGRKYYGRSSPGGLIRLRPYKVTSSTLTYSDNPVKRYRESHPENVVWTPETGWVGES